MPSDYEAITRYNEEQLGKDTASRKSQVNMYSDFSHFVYEILQNADDYGATTVTFKLNKNELVIEHNGIPFEEENVKAISYFGKSTSRDDLVKTGRFGLGFKSVFAFTASTAIHSGKENFEIYDLYRLKGLPHPHDLEPEKTRICLPFNHVEERPDFVETLVPGEKAFDKICRRLKKLDITTLLFTLNLSEIKWTIQDEEGHYLRGDTHKKNISEDFRARKTEITDGDTLHTYLVFSRSIRWHSKEYKPVEIAFFLDDSNKVERIRSTKKPLFVLFPTTQETKIGFSINGPFRTPAHRETISQDDEFNQFLVEKVASLICDALPKIRGMGLLTVSLLETLPIRMDDFPEDGMFYPIVEAVRDALMDHELLPADEGTFVSARNAKLARGAELRKLLTHDPLRELFQSKDDIRWLSGEITQDRTPDLRTYLMSELDVEEIRPERFAQLITDDFLESQTDDWIIHFYNFLGKDKSDLWKKPNSILRQKKILRLEDNSHVIPFQPDGNPNAYLPSSSKTKFPTIKRDIFNDKGAEEFLRNLRLFEPDLFAEVIEFVLPKYIDHPSLVDFQDNIEDLKKVNKLINTPFREEAKNSIAKLRILLSKLGFESLDDKLDENSEELILPFLKMVLPQFKFFHAVNEDREKYKSAKDIYLNNADLHTYFENNPNAWFVDKSYPEDLEELFKELSIGDIPRAKRKHKDCRGYVIIQSFYGWHQRGLNGFDPGIEVDGLEYALTHPTIEKSLFIWKRIAILNADCICGIVESSSRKTFEGSDKEKQTSQKFGRLLMQNDWLPDRQGKLHKPSELELDDLPDSFVRDEKLADSLGMKKNIVSALAEKAGVSVDDINLIKQLKEYPDVYKKIKADILAKKKKTEFPEKALSNAERRKEKIIEKYRNSPKRKYEKKSLSKKTTEQTIDPRTWLRETYTNKERQMICQICQKKMPFKKRNGEYYFEAIELLNDFDREMEELHIALCPLCAAMYNEFVKHDEGAMESLKNTLMNSEDVEVPLQLGELDTSIRFVESHWSDIRTILQEMDYIGLHPTA